MSRPVQQPAPPAPGGTRRRLPAAERRVLILDAGVRTFAARGYDGASMEEIASAAGISKAVVYDHVASKHDLYNQLLEAICDEIERTVEAALSTPGTDGEERVRAAAAAIYGYVEQHGEASRLLVLELHGPNVSPAGLELEERLTRTLADTLGSDPALLGGRPDRALQLTLLAELLKAAVLGLVAWWLRHPEARQADLVERTVELAWPAILRARAGA